MLLSLPPELLLEIIQPFSQRDCCRLRSTCKILNELTEPILFRRVMLQKFNDPLVNEHQIIALATRSSGACKLTKVMAIYRMPDRICASEQSLPHFGHCDDLRVHIPSAISALRNMTCFTYEVYTNDPDWLVNSLLEAVSRLPQLTELHVGTWNAKRARIPYGLFRNLSKLSAQCVQPGVFFCSEVTTAIANSPQLRSLEVVGRRDAVPLPILNKLFAKLSTKNPLRLEHLRVGNMNATVDQATLQHLTRLNSFQFDYQNTSNVRSVWTSFRVNNIKLTDVNIRNPITEESMWYLSSFSGLKRLVLCGIQHQDLTLSNILYSEVLPKHVNSLETLVIQGKIFNHSSSESIVKCRKLRDLSVSIDDSMPVQLLLDTIAHLPELRIFRAHTGILILKPDWRAALVKFKPHPGLRYVEELEIDYTLYVLEKDRGKPVRYREVRY